MALNTGQIVGPYQVIGQLGHGGMATVYKAYHSRLDRNVAIKVMHKAFTEDAGFIARFEREAQIVAKLEHPHIVPVYDFNELDGQPYLVMKFIEGQTLKRVLADGPMPLNEIIRVMDDMAGALTYAHQHGVLHRDIKPSNIVIDINRAVPVALTVPVANTYELGAAIIDQISNVNAGAVGAVGMAAAAPITAQLLTDLINKTYEFGNCDLISTKVKNGTLMIDTSNLTTLVDTHIATVRYCLDKYRSSVSSSVVNQFDSYLNKYEENFVEACLKDINEKGIGRLHDYLAPVPSIFKNTRSKY